MGIGEIFTVLFTQPITNLLVGIYKLLTVVHIPYALGFAIIVLTAVVKIVLHPLVSAQIKSTYKMQKIAPHIASIKEKHKHDSKKQQEEMMRLYKEHNLNPAAGCLPLLIQFIIFISLYNVLSNAVVSSSANAVDTINKLVYFSSLKIISVWDTSFFGLSLSDTPSKIITSNYLILLIPILTSLTQFILSKMMIPATSYESSKNITSKKQGDFQSALQTQSLYVVPVIIGFTSFTFPIGLSIYWIAFTIFGILQQYLLVGPGGITPWLQKLGFLQK